MYRMRRMLALWHNVFDRFIADGCLYRASALTFTTLLALVPLMVVGLTIASAIPMFKEIGQEIQDFIFANFVPSTGQAVQAYLSSFVQKASQLSAFGLLFLLLTSISMLYTIEQTLNVIWRVGRRRIGVSTFILYWSILTLSPILIATSVVLSTYVLSSEVVTSTSTMLGITGSSIVFLMTFFISMIVFSLIYIALPNCHVPIRCGLMGALLASVLFEVMKHAFTLYISHFRTYQLIYGALATIPIFLLWLYLLWLLTLLGAEFSHVLTYRYGHASKQKLDGFSHALRWLYYLWQAQQNGEGLSLAALINRDKCNYEVNPEEVIAMLCQQGWVHVGQTGDYFLSADMSQLTLALCYQALPLKLPAHTETTNKMQQVLNNYMAPFTQEVTSKLDISLHDVFLDVKHQNT